MNIIKTTTLIVLFAFISIGNSFAMHAGMNVVDDEKLTSENNSTRSGSSSSVRPTRNPSPYTLDCIINGNCVTSGDHIKLTDLISATDILSWKEGHGGYAATVNGETFLMDFNETNIGKNAYFNPITVINPFIQRTIDTAFYNEAPSFREQLAKKLSEINDYSTDLAFGFLAGVMTYNWIFVEFDLKATPDIDTVVAVPGVKYTPLANRRQQTVLIHSPTWKKLDDANKVGLIIHELSYSLVLPMFDKLHLTNVDMRLGSMKARELTSYLFRIDSELKKSRGFNIIANNYISHRFTDKVYDIETLVWNDDGSVTLPIGISHIQIQTEIEMLSNNKNKVINWGVAKKDSYEDRLNIKAICQASSRVQSSDKLVSIVVYNIVKGNLNLSFNNSEVSSLVLEKSNDVQANETWMFSFQFSHSSECSRQIKQFIHNL